ncbi:nucleoside triphosphate pyrophosphohydrolase [Tuberibacillus calidus]|jgi:tetrapyrrole methylase family protein/MazG family protein|uniref:nucleoside triphosphate pyrophosphohydrolase n=1 Tax=Tuberibacillus calidus TaxID=340097 RepID=UPI000414793D|nr:nucleoside triphosphate pyrophosphohydrolase [Tuberibacillus calidus]
MTKQITVVGLGSGEAGHLTIGVYERLKKAPKVFLRTKAHPVAEWLKEQGIAFETFDAVYEQMDNFEAVYDVIVARLLEEARRSDLLYAVPGHPMVAEKTVRLLREKVEACGISLRIEGGQSFLDPLFTALNIDPIEGFSFLDASALDADDVPLDQHLIICQVYDAFVASEVKLALLEHLPPDYEVVIATSVGNADESITKVPLSDLDHDWQVSNLTCVYVPPVRDENLLNHTFPRIRKIIRKLRSPEGCPWDRKQTHESLRKYLLEEAFEVIGAIEEQDDDHLVEELGDVLLQVLLHAQIGEDEGYFNIQDVIRSLSEKMIRRHPHVFGESQAMTAEEVIQNWEAIKKQEKKDDDESLMDQVPGGLAPLAKSYEIQKLAAKVGFDWPDASLVWEKIREELHELRKAVEAGHVSEMEEELGDVLFSVVNLARKLDIHPVLALGRTVEKFSRRFKQMENEAQANGRSLSSLTAEEWDKLWNHAKEN